jgi:hypothetical protein
MVAARIAKLEEGRPSKTAPIGAVSQAKAAELLSVSRRSVQRASKVRNKGVPELAEKVERGEISVSAAADIARLAKERQQKIVAIDESAVLKETIKQFRSEEHARKATLPAESIRKRSDTPSGEARDPNDAIKKITVDLMANDSARAIAGQKADKYFAEQEARLGPIAPANRTEEQKIHMAGAVLRPIHARLTSHGIEEGVAHIEAAIRELAKVAGIPDPA